MRIVPERERRVKEGETFNQLTVLGVEFRCGFGKRKTSHRVVVCQCTCGTIHVPIVGQLIGGVSASCGCVRRKMKRHGHSGTRLYSAWANMLRRCRNETSKKYENYGGRGIRVCQEWQRFEPFLAWSLANGYADDREIDRKDSNGNYEPDNCRWVTTYQQTTNHRSRTSTYKGIYFHRNTWVARITVNGKGKYLGRFPDAEQAARAYDVAAREAFGDFSRLNFPE